jgi:cation diffusion facilitator family transporter
LTKLLIRLFVKNSQEPLNSKLRENYGTFAGAVGIATNFLLFLLKITVGLLFNSIAIIADALNNFTDAGSSIVTLIGFKISGKPADAKHPYGHARMEYISGLLVSVIILFLGLQLVQSSVDKIIHPHPPEFSMITVVVLVAAVLIKLWQYFFYQKIGKQIGSTTIIATSIDSRNDVLVTSAILIAVLINYFTGVDLDGYMGVAVSLFILYSGYGLIIETISPLLGMAPTREMVDMIYKKILSYDNIIGLHDLTVHNYGPEKCFASVHCEVTAEQDILVSHDIIDNIERDFLTEMDIHLVIHLDPIVTNDPKTNELKSVVENSIFQISPEIHMHDFRVVWGKTHSNLIFDVVVPFDFDKDDDELIRLIIDKIQTIDINYYAVITVDHDYIPDVAQDAFKA